MVVVVQRQHTENVVVLVAGLAEVTALLLVPVVAIGVAVSALLSGRVDVAAVHVGVGKLGLLSCGEGGADLGELWLESGCCGDDGSSQRAGRYNASGQHAASLLDGGAISIGWVAYVAALIRGYGCRDAMEWCRTLTAVIDVLAKPLGRFRTCMRESCTTSEHRRDT